MRNLSLYFKIILIYGFLSYSTGDVLPSANGSVYNVTQFPRICTSEECHKIAHKIMLNIDTTINPCDDFYTFACGGFKKWAKSLLVGKISSFNYFSLLYAQNLENMKTILESNNNVLNSINITAAKQTYKACMNTSEIKQNGLNRLMNRLNSYGGIPILKGDAWSEKDFDIVEITRDLRKTGYSYNHFLDISCKANIINNTFYNLLVDKPEIESVTSITDRIKYILNIMSKIGGKMNLRMLKEVEELVQFEDKLRGSNLNITTSMSTADIMFDMLNDSFPIRSYMKAILPADAMFSEQSEISFDMLYLEYFNILIKNTPKKVQANYLLWRIIESSITSSFVIDFNAPGPSRDALCLEKVSKLFYNFEIAYLKTYFHAEDETSAEELVKHIQNAFADKINNSLWLDSDSKKATLRKLNDMNIFVGYANYSLNGTISKFFVESDFGNKSFEQIITTIDKFLSDTSLNNTGKPVGEHKWMPPPCEVNAFYSLDSNSVFISAGILNGAFFGKDRPHYVNYGALGIIIGHEFSHAFDSSGIQFDEKGNYNTLNWSENSTAEYFDRVECVINQFMNYTINNMTMDPYFTLEEDLSDIGGISLAYAAYLQWEKENGPELVLPNLYFNQKQLFWISTANAWCSKDSDEFIAETINVSDHSISEMRILRSFANSPEFSRDFNCPVGTKMNPAKKCKIW